MEKEKKNGLRVFWDTYLVNNKNGRAHQEYYLDKWHYENGKLYDLGEKRDERVEHMYLHFINWKKTMKVCEITYSYDSTDFFISYDAIHLNKNKRERILYNDFKNLFNGYWVQEKRRIRKKKQQKLIKRGIKKLFG